MRSPRSGPSRCGRAAARGGLGALHRVKELVVGLGHGELV